MDAIALAVIAAGSSVSACLILVARELRSVRETLAGPDADPVNLYRRPIRASMDPASRV